MGHITSLAGTVGGGFLQENLGHEFDRPAAGGDIADFPKTPAAARRRQNHHQKLVLGVLWIADLDGMHTEAVVDLYFQAADRAQRIEGRHQLPVLGLAWRGVALPLFWAVLDKPDTSDTEERIALWVYPITA